MAGTSINCLANVLKDLGWSYTRLIAELRRHSTIALPKTESMVTLISRWVNNHQQPDDFYRDLLSKATGRARAELFSDEPLGITSLPSGLAVASSEAGLPATGGGPLSSGGDGLIAWLGQQESELRDGAWNAEASWRVSPSWASTSLPSQLPVPPRRGAAANGR